MDRCAARTFNSVIAAYLTSPPTNKQDYYATQDYVSPMHLSRDIKLNSFKDTNQFIVNQLTCVFML